MNDNSLDYKAVIYIALLFALFLVLILPFVQAMRSSLKEARPLEKPRLETLPPKKEVPPTRVPEPPSREDFKKSLQSR